MYNTYHANINNQRHIVSETVEARIQRLRRSISDIKAGGGNPAAYERVLAKLIAQHGESEAE